MDEKTRRKHLDDYTRACRDIELTGVAIEILEGVSNAASVVTALKRRQQTHLRRIDAAAEKIGAPYGA